MNLASRDIEQAITHALGARGLSGSVVVRGSTVELHRAGSPPVVVDAGSLVREWGTLPPGMRDRGTVQIAEQLGQAVQRASSTLASPPATGREIETALGEAIGGFGVAGQVVLNGKHLELYAGGAPIAIDVTELVEQWPLLPPDMRRRKVEEVARRFLAARNVAGIASPTRGTEKSSRGALFVVVPAGALVLLGLLAFFGIRAFLGRGAADASPAADAGLVEESPEQARARRARVCDAARRRVYSGASIGPFDTEGWYAELWLASAKAGGPLRAHPDIQGLADKGRLSASADATLAALPDGTLELVDGFAAERAGRAGAWRAVTIRFGGRYAGAFLDPATRPRFLALSDRLADAVGADVGALYGRCAHLTFRDVGAWFRGNDAAAAASALVYGVGLFAEAPAVDEGALAKLGGSSELDAMRAAAAKVDNMTLATLVGSQGGNVASPSGGGIVITFPALAGTRAITASRAVARRMKIEATSN